jgi:hypothetical protein
MPKRGPDRGQEREQRQRGTNDDGVEVPKPVFNHLENIRKSGKTNMFDVETVMWLAYETEHDRTVVWVDEHRDQYVEGVMRGFKPVSERSAESAGR